jgi:uncharacterized protein involved in outer membrane biogenesis
MRTSGRILIVIAVLVGAALLARNWIAEGLITRSVKKRTGFDSSLGSVEVGVLSPTFELRGFKLLNPPDFPDTSAIDTDRVFVRYDRRSLLADNKRLSELVLDIPRIVMVKKPDKETNLERLHATSKPSGRASSAPPKPETTERMDSVPSQLTPAGAAEKPRGEVTIDRLTFKLGKVEIHDYSKGGDKPVITTIDVNMDRTYQNVTNFQQLSEQVALEVALQGGMNELNKRLKDPETSRKLDKTIDSIGRSIGDFLKKHKPPDE